jgi:uncharacterized protein YjiS (DUF1127 family)
MTQFMKTVRRLRHRSLVRHELGMLSKHQLRDIGMERIELPNTGFVYRRTAG